MHATVIYEISQNSMAHELTEHWTTPLPKLALQLVSFMPSTASRACSIGLHKDVDASWGLEPG